MSPNLEHGMTTAMLVAHLQPFVREHDLGAVAVEVDHYMPGDKYNTRRPDISFYSKGLLELLAKDAFVPLMPDLAIEIKSPTNSNEELRQKAAYYLQNGCRMVWLFFSDTKTVGVYTPGTNEPLILGIDDILDGGDVLPGFRLPVKSIFP